MLVVINKHSFKIYEQYLNPVLKEPEDAVLVVCVTASSPPMGAGPETWFGRELCAISNCDPPKTQTSWGGQLLKIWPNIFFSYNNMFTCYFNYLNN